MLHLLTENTYCFIWPDKVLLTKRCGLGKQMTVAKEWIYINSDNKEDLFSGLAVVIKKPEWRRKMNIVLCGNLVNYRIIKHDSRLTRAEHLMLARHQFQQVYGREVGTWQVFLQKMCFERNNLAVAVDDVFLQKLQSTFEVAEIKLLSIRPCVTEWMNSIRKDFKKSGWIAFMAQPEVLILKIKNKELILCCQSKAGDIKQTDVQQILTREALKLGELVDFESVARYQIVDGWPEMDCQTIRGSTRIDFSENGRIV